MLCKGIKPYVYWFYQQFEIFLLIQKWFGADNRTWTYDLLITNEPLYQLSYAGMTT